MYLREIHHRVKNNLQIVSSLLFLRSTYTHDPETLAILKESQSRVRSIALIHEKLYRSPEITRIDFSEYVRDLVSDLFHTYGVREEVVAVSMKIEDVSLETDTAIPCGLIINELVSNVLKHAFPDQAKGRVTIELAAVGSKLFALQVRDDGVGLAPDYDWRTGSSLGLKLVEDLTRQMEGAMAVHVDGGTTFRITFREILYKDRG
jgi:two-component sensor histidine kinase